MTPAVTTCCGQSSPGAVRCPRSASSYRTTQGRVCAEAELAWPDKQVAVVLPERVEAAGNLPGARLDRLRPTASPDEIPC